MQTGKRKQFSAGIYPVILFLAALGMQAVCYFQRFRLRIRPDDFGPLIYPAALAGYDWTEYVSGTDNYYGFGYYWIFAPLFRWIRSPRRLLLAMIAVNCMLVVCSALLIYYLLRRYFKLPDGVLTLCIALVPTFYHGKLPQTDAFWVRTDNETPFYVICWLFIWILLAASHTVTEQKRGKRRILLSAAGAAVLCWAMTVHERAMALLLAAVVLVLLLFLLKHRWLFAPGVFFPVLAAGFVGQRLLRNAIIRHFWAGGWPEKNTSAFSRVSLWFLKSKTALKTFALILFGNTHALLICGFGIPVIALAAAVAWMVRSIRQRVALLRTKESASLQKAACREEWISPEMLVIMLAGICIAIIVLGIAVRWGNLLLAGIEKGKVVYAYKGICYNRYFFLFCGPLLLGSLVLLHRHAGSGWKGAAWIWALFAALEGIFMGFVFPYCRKGGETYLKRTLGPYFTIGSGGVRQAFILSFALMVLVLALLTLAMVRGRRWLFAGVAVILAVFGISRAQQMDGNGFSFSLYKGENTYAVLCELEDAGALPEEVYVPDDKLSHVLQFMNREIPMRSGVPGEDAPAEDILVLCAERDEALEERMQGWEFKDYWFYTGDPQAAKVLEELVAEKGAQKTGA